MKILEPPISGLCPLQAEDSSVQDLSDIDLPVCGFEDLGSVVQLANQVLDASLRLDVDLRWGNCEQQNTATKLAEDLVTYHIHLVKDDNIRKLNLVHHKIRHSPLILRLDIITTRREHVVRLKVVIDREGVNYRDGGIQAGKLLQPTSCLPNTQVSTCLFKRLMTKGGSPRLLTTAPKP